MPGSTRRSLHPLLLEPGYWHRRLDALRSTQQSVLVKARPELSSGSVRVDEFRLKTHDGIRLYGLRGHNEACGHASAAIVRVVGPSELPQIDRSAVERGAVEFVVQQRAGRKLEDRVLDVLRVCQMAAQAPDGMRRAVRLVARDETASCDEFLIASQLFAEEIAPPLPHAPEQDDGVGWSAS